MDAGRVRRQLLRGPARGRVLHRGRRDGRRARRTPGLAGGPGGPHRRRRHRHLGVRGDRVWLPRRRHRPAGRAQERPAELRATPAARARRRRSTGSGSARYEKVALAFDEPFWRHAGWSHLVLFPPDPAEPASWVFDFDAFGAGPILVCHTFHSAAGHVRRGLDRRGGRLGDRHALGGPRLPVPPARGGRRHRLGGRPLLGWLVHPRPTRLHERRPRPARRRPWPADSCSPASTRSSARVGYVDGAMTSGIREAKRLLGTPQVTLGVRAG